MPERERILAGTDACALAKRWAVAEDTMSRVVLSAIQFETETGRGVWIISGYRQRFEQDHLRKSGRPTAPDELSTHRSCPATGVDVSMGPGMTRPMKATWGRIVVMTGLRWGGGGTELEENGIIPLDWQHVDRGPR